MRNLLRFASAAAVLSVSVIAAQAETFTVSNATFSDTSSSKNNDFNFTGGFQSTSFNLTGGVGASTTDTLTINVGNATCTHSSPCGGSTTDALSVTIDFSAPSSQSGSFSGTGGDTYLTYSGWVSNNDIDWTNNTQTVTFADGSSVQLYLPDFTITDSIFGGNNQEDLKITVEGVASAAAPEPSSLMLLGTGLIGGVGAIRRKLAR